MRTHNEITNELFDLYKAKNSDYGDSFDKLFDEFGITSSIIRLQDKLNRLKKLNIDGFIPQVKEESVKDTLQDLANYAIMTLMRM